MRKCKKDASKSADSVLCGICQNQESDAEYFERLKSQDEKLRMVFEGIERGPEVGFNIPPEASLRVIKAILDGVF